MSFRIARKASRDSGGTAPPGRREVRTLSPELLAAGVRRLKFVGGLMFGVVVVFAALDLLIPPPVPPTARLLALAGAALGGILSLAVLFLATRPLDPAVVLDLALVYEVLLALAISINFHAVPLALRESSRGWSAVAVWVLVFPLVIPGTRGKVVLATLAAAAMDPLGLLVHVATGMPAAGTAALVQSFSSTAVAVPLAIAVSGLMYRLSVEASQAREMGSYRLVELLGAGGMGEVWRAEHRMLARAAAIKLIRPEGSGMIPRELVRRFEREARATATLRSPHTVQIYDYGTIEDGTFYYVMELLEGFDGETLVREFGPLPPERAIHLLRQACLSLAEAHQGGLVHRDIKPANLYVCRYGIEFDFVKILDFGLVKSSGPLTDATLTAAGAFAGTPGYIAPEVALGSADVDWRADIYGLGCVGYFLVTGAPVFERASPVEMLFDHARTPPISPSQRARRVFPAGLDETLLACLEKDPRNRPQSAEQLSEALGAITLESSWTADDARRWWLRHSADRARPRSAAAPESAPRLLARRG